MTSPLAINYNTPTGIVIVVFAISQSIATVVERADDNGSGSAGMFASVATFPSTDLAGTPFLDLLPDDGQERYYRAKHIHAGYLDSGYTATVTARPAIIPAGLDLSSRPWLYNSSIPLQLVMDVVADSTSSLLVSASVNLDPAGLGTPSVSVLSYSSNLSAPINVGYLQYLIQKPASGQGRVTFTNTLSGRQSGLDSIDIQAADVASTSSFLTLIMNQVSSSATSVTVSSSVVNPSGYPYNVSLYSYSGGITPIAGSTGIWTIGRPTSSYGTAVFEVTSSLAGVVNDFADVDVDYLNLTPLSVIAKVTGVTTSSVTATFNVTDPYTPSGSIAGITFTLASQSLSSFTASLGTLTNANGVYSQVVTATRPDYGSGTGQILGTAFKTGYTPGADQVSVPEIVSGLAHLVTGAIVTAESATTVTVSGSCYDPMGSGSASATISMSMFPNVAFTGTNPWVINRPLSSSVQVTVFGTKIGRVPDTATATVASNPAAITESDFLELYISQISDTVTTMTISSSVGNAASHPLTFAIISSENDGGITDLSNGGYSITRPSSGTATYHFQVSTTDAGIVNGTKTFYVDSANDTDLNCDWKQVSNTATTITVDVIVTDPFNTTSTLSGVTLTESDTGNAGFTATLNSTTANTGNTTYRYTLSKPNPGAGLAGVTWTATKSGYGAGVASLTVPEEALTFLYCTATAISSSTLDYTVSVTGSDYINDWTAPTIALSNPQGITTNRASTSNSASTVYEVWTLNRPPMGTSPAGVIFTANKTGRISFSAPFTVANQDATGSSGGGGGGDTSVAAFYESSFANDPTNTITLTWNVNNAPAGGTYDIVYHQTLSDGTSDDAGTVSNVTSPYAFGTVANGTIELVSKGTTGWAYSTHTFQLRVKNSGATTVATANITVNHYGIQQF